MKAAIYARKSNDDNDKGEANKSVTRQIEHAKAYAKQKGWVVSDDHVYVDDGISGAEYIKRRGLQRMLSDLKEFDVIVASENSRIGRDQYGNSYVFKELKENDVRLFFYLTDEELKFDSAIDQFMANVQSFASQMERERIAQRTRDALERKAKNGFSAGGRCYGYDNVWVFKDGTRMVAPPKTKKGENVDHTEYQINEDEAKIVRGVFKMYADGYGHVAIAKALNGDNNKTCKGNKCRHDHVSLNMKYFNGARPASPQNGTNSWAPSAIRAMLYRNRYFGIVEYGATKNKRSKEVITYTDKKLRIIDEVLWHKVQKRLKDTRETYIQDNNGHLWGRPETGRESKYLLSGLGKCTCCGGTITITGGQKHSHYYYGCSYNQRRGNRVCENDHRARMREMDTQVIEAIRGTVLNKHAVDYIIDKSMEILVQRLQEKPEQVPELQSELAKVKKELARFIDIIAQGDAPQSVLDAIKEREVRAAYLEAELSKYESLTPDVSELEIRRFRKDAMGRIEKFDSLLLDNTARARQAMRKLLRNEAGDFIPLRVSPVMMGGDKTLTFEGQILASRVFNNVGAEERT